MARPVYSALLTTGIDVSVPISLGGPPAGYLWVARFICMTVGAFLGFVSGGVSVGGEDPWLYLTSSSVSKIVGTHHQSFYWEGRMVIPAGTELWAQTEAGDTSDWYVSGYELSVD